MLWSRGMFSSGIWARRSALLFLIFAIFPTQICAPRLGSGCFYRIKVRGRGSGAESGCARGESGLVAVGATRGEATRGEDRRGEEQSLLLRCRRPSPLLAPSLLKIPLVGSRAHTQRFRSRWGGTFFRARTARLQLPARRITGATLRTAGQPPPAPRPSLALI